MHRWLNLAVWLFIGLGMVEEFQGAERVPWTTSRFIGTPEPSPPYITAPAFPKLKFREPLEMVHIPGTDRWILVEHAGKIFTFKNDRNVSAKELLIDFKQLHPETTEVYSITFHPGFATNRYVFIFLIGEPEKPDGTHISRFELTKSDPPKLIEQSERVVFTWKSGGHNGGQIRFGPDGYLYISTGDGAGPAPPDPLNTGQDISDLLGSILRINVDAADPGKTYGVPKDNPFVNHAGARPEIWAYGFRNPWRFCFDPRSGELWTGDVGWELWEMIHRVEKGGNYGWSVMEGTRQKVRQDLAPGPTPILPPIVEHSHDEAASITGGEFYYGKRFPELAGSYIYADFEMGTIWKLTRDYKSGSRPPVLADTRHKIASFGVGADGELYIVDLDGGIHQLERNPAVHETMAFPRRLSESGLFSDISRHELASGVIGYEIEAAKWQDHARGERFVGIPGHEKVRQNEEKWGYPEGTVIAETYTLEMESGNAASARRVETQVLQRKNGRWNPYTYQWNEAGTDAELVPLAGTNQTLRVVDAAAPGAVRIQNWRFNSRSECLRCHNMWTKGLIAFDHSQIKAGEIDAVLPSRKQLPEHTFVNPYSPEGDLDARARSYLHVNCSPCHRENAGGSVMSFMDIGMPMRRAGLTNKIPAQGLFGIPKGRVIAPADPDHSLLYYRVAKSGSGHMPLIGSSLIDVEGVKLLHDWIRRFPGETITSTPPKSEADIRSAMATVPTALSLMRAMDAKALGPEVETAVLREIAGANPLVRDLLERFVPDDQRVWKSEAIHENEILALPGNAARGSAFFRSESSAQCQSCHRAENVGKEFGPDLEVVARKYDRSQLLQHIQHPSLYIDPAFMVSTVEDSEENIFTGFISEQTEGEMTLRTQNGIVRLDRKKIKTPVRQQMSVMPEGLLQGLKAGEIADLLAYIESLK